MHAAYHPFELFINQTIELNEEESWHLVKVARIELNETIKVINGNGKIGEAVVINNHPKHTQVLIKNVRDFEKPLKHLHLIVAPTKVADRMEWMLEKAVELGLHELSIIITDRTERKKVNTERLYKIALAAAKQSKNPWLIKIHEPISFNSFVTNNLNGEKYIAHCEENQSRTSLKSVLNHDTLNVLIGPEGDFTPNEIELAKQNGFKPVLLTQNILRAETAAVYACSLFAD